MGRKGGLETHRRRRRAELEAEALRVRGQEDMWAVANERNDHLLPRDEGGEDDGE